jgi:hypothetical protein
MGGHEPLRNVVQRVFLSAASRARGHFGALHLSDDWVARAMSPTPAALVREAFWNLLRPNGPLECDPYSRKQLDFLAPDASYERLPDDVDLFLQGTRIQVRITPLGERVLEQLLEESAA